MGSWGFNMKRMERVWKSMKEWQGFQLLVCIGRLVQRGLVVSAPPCSLYGPCCSSIHRRSTANPYGDMSNYKVRLARLIWSNFVPWQLLIIHIIPYISIYIYIHILQYLIIRKIIYWIMYIHIIPYIYTSPLYILFLLHIYIYNKYIQNQFKPFKYIWITHISKYIDTYIHNHT